MLGILVSAFNAILAWLVRSVLVKFVLFFGLWFVTTEFMQVLAPYLPDASALSSALGGLPADLWYFLDLFKVSYGVPLVLSAYVTRFAIRRLPIIG